MCNTIIIETAKGKIYADTAVIPFNRVGILLGTAKYIQQKYHNPYYDYRIEAAIKLLKVGKIKYILVSGDNSRNDYNEPESMRTDLMHAGVDSSIIYLDYAGFRTYDSMIRLKEVFGQDSVTIISQQFHNERALYIASRIGICAIAFNATDIGGTQGLKTQWREKMARVKTFLDFWFGKKTRFLGEKVVIPRE